jgi:hypothetical protein
MKSGRNIANRVRNRPRGSTEIQKRQIRSSDRCAVEYPTCGAVPGVCWQGEATANGKRVLIHDTRDFAAGKLGEICWHTFRHQSFVAGRDRSSDEGAAGTDAKRLHPDDDVRLWIGNVVIEAGSEWEGR